MNLQYHQAIHDFITNKLIDTAPFLTDLDEYERQIRHLTPQRRLWTTLSLFGQMPLPSDAQIHQLDKWEADHRIRLPEAVREWYSLEIALPLLFADGSWWPSALNEFAYNSDTKAYLGFDSVVFMNEQQSGDLCFALDGNADPAVYWLGSGINPDGTQSVLPLAAPHFSHFIHCRLWDWLVDYRSAYSFRVTDLPHIRPLSLERKYFVTLEYMRSRFEELPFQAFREHRFFNAAQYMAMSQYANEPDLVGGGRFYADDSQSLLNMISTIWEGTLPLRKIQPWKGSHNIIGALNQI